VCACVRVCVRACVSASQASLWTRHSARGSKHGSSTRRRRRKCPSRPSLSPPEDRSNPHRQAHAHAPSQAGIRRGETSAAPFRLVSRTAAPAESLRGQRRPPLLPSSRRLRHCTAAFPSLALPSVPFLALLRATVGRVGVGRPRRAGTHACAPRCHRPRPRHRPSCASSCCLPRRCASSSAARRKVNHNAPTHARARMHTHARAHARRDAACHAAKLAALFCARRRPSRGITA
jgi:hypothetical protein